MPFDLRESLRRSIGTNYELHAEHVNPQFAKVLKTIGYDHVYVRAQGAYLWDDAGRQYLDFLSGYAVCNMGRNHPVIKKALADFLALDFPSMVQFEAPALSGMLAAELKRLVDCPLRRRLDYVFFTNSGTEGVEAAIKFAKCATGRPGVVSTHKAFHGLTTGSLSLNGCESFTTGFAPHLPGTRSIPFNDLAALERELDRGDVAAFIVEPIQGKGVNMPAPGYLAEAARLCHRRGALFVADEVQTGVGRTGSFLAIDQEGEVDADIIVMSKALSGGYVPVGAVLTRKSVWTKVFSSMERAIVHSSTFHQGSLAMVAGLASLAVYEEERLDENARRMGSLLREGLDRLMGRFEFIRDVRGRGLMLAVEFGEPRSLSLRAGWKLVNAMDKNLFAQAVVIPLMADHRILCQVAGHNQAVVKLIPPLTINEQDVAWFLNAFEAVMTALHRFPGPAFDVLKRLGSNAFGSRERDIDGAVSSVAGP